MMSLYIPESHKNRTEYQLLSDWYELIPISFEGLFTTSQSSKMVLVGRLLDELNDKEMSILNKWTFYDGNQLICLPSWKEIDISNYLDLGIDMKIIRKDVRFDQWHISELKYIIKGKLQNGIVHKSPNGDLITINYKENQYSGILTITTLPLLDYNLIIEEEKLKEEFTKLLVKKSDKKKEKNDKKDDLINLPEKALYIILLAAAGLNIKDSLTKKIELYFYQKLNPQYLDIYISLLIDKELFNKDKSITEKGIDFIKSNGYIAYVREIKRRMRD